MEPLDDKQQIGYLIARIEDIASSQQSLATEFNLLKNRVDEKFKTAEVVFKILKFLGLALIAIVTFKFGDISRLWSYIFG